MRVRARISDVDEENHDDTTEPAADTVITVDITADRAWTRADLLDAVLKATAEGRRGNSNTAVTFSLDQIKYEVTWNANVTITPPIVALVMASFAPTVLTPRLVTPPIIALLLSSFAASVLIGTTITPPIATLTLTSFAAEVTASLVSVEARVICTAIIKAASGG